MYIAVFVCFTSKAVPLELVSDLSTDSFLLSFNRFAARRGLLREVLCDERNEFRRSQQCPHSAPAGIRQESTRPRILRSVVRRHLHTTSGAALRKAVGSSRQTGEVPVSARSGQRIAEEIETILAETEAVLNSRLIAPLSPDL